MRRTLITLTLMTLSLVLLLQGCRQPVEDTVSSSSEQSAPLSSLPKEEEKEEEPKLDYNPLTGTYTLDPSRSGQRAVAVMFNNAKASWPQKGTGVADILFEWPYEGTMTRIMGLYADYTQAETFASLRSTRHDFVELAESFDAILVHWGGSKPGYAALSNYGTDHIDGMTSPYMERDQERINAGVALEHTGMIRTERLTEALERFDTEGEIPEAFTFWQGEEPLRFADTTAKQAIVPISGDITCRINYDATRHQYIRREHNMLQEDGNTGEPLRATNVFLLVSDITSYQGSSVWKDLHLENGGEGYYLTEGTKTAIRWGRESMETPLTFTKEDGSDLAVNPGKSWVIFIASDQVEFS